MAGMKGGLAVSIAGVKPPAVMDQTAFALCRENDMPIVVFNLDEPRGVVRAAHGEPIGTLIHN